MAQNITLLGASYSAVPSVLLPKTGGGTASFTDVTDTTATASDVASGKYFYTAAGVLTEGTSSGGGTPAISIVDTTDSAGGTIRTITALDISDTTAVASDVASGKYFYTAAGVRTAGTGGGGTPSATQHVIHLEFTDSTDTDINVYYDDSLISTMITSYDPVTYSSKTVDSAALDNVIWYQRPSETWETLYNGTTRANEEQTYASFWIAELGNVSITVGSTWRITLNNEEFRCTVTSTMPTYGPIIGNPLFMGGTDDGSNVTFALGNAGWGAWVGATSLPAGVYYPLKVERLVTS